MTVKKLIAIVEHEITEKKRLAFNRKGIIAIEKIIGKGEQFLFATNKIDGFYFDPRDEQKFVVIEITHKEKLKNSSGKEYYKKEIYFVDFEKEKIKLISFPIVKEMLETGEISLYQ